MKKIIFYPFLISINPVLLMYTINVNDLSSSIIFPIILYAVLLTLGAMWVLSKFIKDYHRIGYILFLFTFWFYYYIPVRILFGRINIGSIDLTSHWVVFPIWSLLIILLASNHIWRKIRSPQTITLFLNIVGIILVGFSIYRITINIIPRYLVKPDIQEIIQSLPVSLENKNSPDIYYIIFDGYAREDVLQELYNYDNSEFINELEEMGFFVADQSQSNYIHTVMSLASSLNMEYLQGPSSIIAKQMPIHGQFIGMINHNRTRSLLTQLGYKFISFSTGFPPTELTNSDIFYSPPETNKTNNLEALLMMNSILEPLIEGGMISTPIVRYNSIQSRINYAFDKLTSEIPFINGPKMVFIHIVAPHAPFIFDQNGPISPNEPLNLLRSDIFFTHIDQYKQMYVSDLTYLNKRIIKSINSILLNSSTPPIIILQSDHGPDTYMDWNTGINTCMKERFSILNAYYFPNGGSNQLTNDISPVNTFAVLFNYYFGTDVEILANHQYYATWENPLPYMDASDISQSCDIR